MVIYPLLGQFLTVCCVGGFQRAEAAEKEAVTLREQLSSASANTLQPTNQIQEAPDMVRAHLYCAENRR